MNIMILRKGLITSDGRIEIVDEDRLCWIVKDNENGGQHIKTISKSLLQEFLTYVSQKPKASVLEIKYYLADSSNSDRVELEYSNTLMALSNIVLGKIDVVQPHIKPANCDRSRYSINGEGKFPKKNLSTELIRMYIKLNPFLSANDVIDQWRSLGSIVEHFIESEPEYYMRTDKNKSEVNILTCNGELIYVSTKGWGNLDRITTLLDAVNRQDWGLKAQKI